MTSVGRLVEPAVYLLEPAVHALARSLSPQTGCPSGCLSSQTGCPSRPANPRWTGSWSRFIGSHPSMDWCSSAVRLGPQTLDGPVGLVEPAVHVVEAAVYLLVGALQPAEPLLCDVFDDHWGPRSLPVRLRHSSVGAALAPAGRCQDSPALPGGGRGVGPTCFPAKNLPRSASQRGGRGWGPGREGSQGLDSNQRPTVLQTAALNQLSYPG